MKINLKGRTAWVTGASRGIGRAAAEGLAGAGARVILTARGAAGVEETARAISQNGGEVLGLSCDVSDAKSVQEVMHKALDKFGAVDILVNNAGLTKDGLLVLMKEEDWNEVLTVNLKGAFHCTKAVARGMIKRRWGRIVNMSSIIGVKGGPGQANYAASKAGLIGFTKSIALELGSRGVTVNAITPGFIETAMTQTLPETHRQAVKTRVPLGRFGTPEEVARLVVFLASEEAGYITGQAIGVDGGLAIG